MASTAQFQLFPPPAKDKRPMKPFRNNLSRKEIAKNKSPPSPVPLEDLKAAVKTESVIIQIIDDTNGNIIQPPPQAHIDGSRSAATTPEPPRNITSLESHGNAPGPEERSGSSLSHVSQKTDPGPRAGTARSIARLQQTPPSYSPVVAMQSMFPRYNPQLPLTQQAYFPRTMSASQSGSESPSLVGGVPPSDVDVLLGPKTVPASVMDFPTNILSPRVQYSNPEELLGLWESANGQQLQESLGKFTLRMERIDTGTFTFGDPLLPFYTLQVHSNNGLSVMRNHPLKPNRSVPVMNLKLEDRARRQPPHDGLVTVIFSRLAAMLAVEQATELTRQHHLAPTEAMEVETHAVSRAAAQESCRLIWNERQNRYELQHPSLLTQQSASLVGEDGIPLSRVQTAKPGTLHITVSPALDSDSIQAPTIVVTSPAFPNAVEAANSAATPRTSTLPHTDDDEPLASLDLNTMCLSICAGVTTAIIPSLYAIDSLIAAIVAVAISDSATNAVLADTEIYIPGLETPRTPARRNRFRNSVATTVQTARTAFTGKFVATLAEREDVEEEVKLMNQIRSSESKNEKKKDKGSFFRFGGGSSSKAKSKPKKKTKQIVIEEFDLEKYGHYGHDSSRKGQELPGVTRTLLSILVFGLEVVVAILSMGVKCLAWILVNVTRCVTSEKF